MTRQRQRKIEVAALEIEQAGTKLYVFAMDGETLFRISTISRREEDKERGYQRILKRSRANQIASYIDNQRGMIPNNLIVAFKDSVKYTDGKLQIPDEPEVALVIDGQHRLWGLHTAKTRYKVLVVGFIGLELIRQKELFITINKYQKGVPASLYLDLLPEIKDLVEVDPTQYRAVDIVKELNDDETSPWYGQINMTGEGKGVISLTNFVRKLKPLLGQPPLSHFLYEEQYRLIYNYFTAVQAVFVDQWTDGRSLIRKTVGFGALMNALPEIFNITTRERLGEFTVDAISGILKLVQYFRFDRASLGAGSGTAAERAASDMLLEALMANLRLTKEEKGERLVRF
jgi:DGQHR domain-containing protein